MKLFKHIIILVLLVGLAACSTQEENFPIDLDAVLNNNGAYLRVVDVESAGFDILDLDNAAYIFTGEAFDVEEGELLDNVEFFVRYSGTDGTVLEETGPFLTVDRSQFQRGGQNNLPQFTFNIPIDDILTPLGLTRDDLLIGDQFVIRWDLNLTDGRTFSADDASPDITGGSFFRSPYQARPGVVAAIPQDQFVGSYNFTQQRGSQSVAGAFAGGWILEGSQSFDADIIVNPDNTLNGRTFTATPLAEFGVGSQNYAFDIALANEPENNSVTLRGTVGTGLACSAIGITYGPAGSTAGDFDVTDDSEFTLVIRENNNGDCGLDPDDVPFTVTKN